MATVTLKKCDVFKTTTEENTGVRIVFTEPSGLPDGSDVVLFDKVMDMSPRAIERAKNFLTRATTPPPPKATADAS